MSGDRRRRLATVAGEGDRRATLERLRQELAAAIDARPEPRDLAALSRRLEAVLAEIDGLEEVVDDGDVVDDLQRRREGRMA